MVVVEGKVDEGGAIGFHRIAASTKTNADGFFVVVVVVVEVIVVVVGGGGGGGSSGGDGGGRCKENQSRRHREIMGEKKGKGEKQEKCRYFFPRC